MNRYHHTPALRCCGGHSCASGASGAPALLHHGSITAQAPICPAPLPWLVQRGRRARGRGGEGARGHGLGIAEPAGRQTIISFSFCAHFFFLSSGHFPSVSLAGSRPLPLENQGMGHLITALDRGCPTVRRPAYRRWRVDAPGLCHTSTPGWRPSWPAIQAHQDSRLAGLIREADPGPEDRSPSPCPNRQL